MFNEFTKNFGISKEQQIIVWKENRSKQRIGKLSERVFWSKYINQKEISDSQLKLAKKICLQCVVPTPRDEALTNL